MSLILCIETSTKSCSVALGQNGKIIGIKESLDEKHSHAKNLTLYIQDVIAQGDIKLKDVDAVAISKGPGSYTGLRIGVSTAKGLCYAIDKPLLAINTLEAMALGQISNLSEGKNNSSLFCSMIDARRMEVYCAIYNNQLHEIKKTSADVIDENSFSDLLKNNKIYFFGDGASKCKSSITHTNAFFINEVHPTAKHMLPLAEKLMVEKRFEDLAYFEPYYLKDFLDSKASSHEGKE